MQQLVEFAGNHILLVSALTVTGSLLLFTLFRDSKGSLVPNEATTLINRKEAVVIDVRSQADFARGHIINAISIPSNGFADQLNVLEKHKAKPIIIYCASGATSTQACSTLKKAGFEQVFNLKGGIMAWLNDSLPTTRK
ncbi:MAG: rhodanese-like domain-containing protein [Candidatus Polarisedimenticolaceae bacterium]|nr:rhodanese-like domain-containing protein [Candidatus Polarisedimenticolaceae bacterium]